MHTRSHARTCARACASQILICNRCNAVGRPGPAATCPNGYRCNPLAHATEARRFAENTRRKHPKSKPCPPSHGTSSRRRRANPREHRVSMLMPAIASQRLSEVALTPPQVCASTWMPAEEALSVWSTPNPCEHRATSDSSIGGSEGDINLSSAWMSKLLLRARNGNAFEVIATRTKKSSASMPESCSADAMGAATCDFRASHQKVTTATPCRPKLRGSRRTPSRPLTASQAETGPLPLMRRGHESPDLKSFACWGMHRHLASAVVQQLHAYEAQERRTEDWRLRSHLQFRNTSASRNYRGVLFSFHSTRSV